MLQKNNISRYIFLVIFAFLFISSCKNSSSFKLVYSENETIKEQINKKESEISWTKELEGDRLTDTDFYDDIVDTSKIYVLPNVVKVLKDYNNPVYPELVDFVRLDTSLINKSLLNRIEDFCAAVCKNIYSGPSQYFENTYVFNYVFFKNDLIDNWQKKFNASFSITEEESKKINEQINKNIQIEEQIKSLKFNTELSPDQLKKEEIELQKGMVKIEKKDIFTDYVIGEPFTSDDIMEVPVRFYCKYGTVDITLYIKVKSNYIYQITIDRWGTQ